MVVGLIKVWLMSVCDYNHYNACYYQALLYLIIIIVDVIIILSITSLSLYYHNYHITIMIIVIIIIVIITIIIIYYLVDQYHAKGVNVVTRECTLNDVTKGVWNMKCLLWFEVWYTFSYILCSVDASVQHIVSVVKYNLKATAWIYTIINMNYIEIRWWLVKKRCIHMIKSYRKITKVIKLISW